jgi:Flavodoxin-like fold
LLLAKKATVITSGGWVYLNGSPLASSNHHQPWIRAVFGLIGVTRVDFVVADGLAEIERGKRERESYLRPIREEVALANRTGNRSHQMQGSFGALRVDPITGFLITTRTST